MMLTLGPLMVGAILCLPLVAKAIPAAAADPDIVIPSFEGLRESFTRDSRHFSAVDVCGDAICDQMVRQANGLARIKMIRKYVVNAIGMMDSLVTALDAELIVAGEMMSRSLGNRCRAAHAVLNDVTKGPTDSDRLNGKSSAFVYGRDSVSRDG